MLGDSFSSNSSGVLWLTRGQMFTFFGLSLILCNYNFHSSWCELFAAVCQIQFPNPRKAKQDQQRLSPKCSFNLYSKPTSSCQQLKNNLRFKLIFKHDDESSSNVEGYFTYRCMLTRADTTNTETKTQFVQKMDPAWL